MKPLVSIILPTYNGERYLASAINSCLAQTMTDWELIIVDDCSTDRTPEIIHSFQQKDQRIRCIRNGKNLKLSTAGKEID
jgi:glycosyltransferase involved in cell wall biosynthesis